eukprot:GHVU01023222.1.p2 GENE.GHVU01023222.1~~GHVU01023222.1.p2  ORF type:complete len:112 (-),score=19.80 GHVU01023222.1:160-468(-)
MGYEINLPDRQAYPEEFLQGLRGALQSRASGGRMPAAKYQRIDGQLPTAVPRTPEGATHVKFARIAQEAEPEDQADDTEIAQFRTSIDAPIREDIPMLLRET